MRRLRGLPGDSDGNVAIEYAFVAPAFIALLLGILHIALIYLAQEGLETAVESAARLIMTGEAQTLTLKSGSTSYTGMTAADFKSAVCTGISGTNSAGSAVSYPGVLPPFLSCGRLAVTVEVVPATCTSPSIVNPTYTYSGGTLTGGGYGTINCTGTTNTNAGLATTQGQLVIVQLGYAWPTISAPLGLNFVNLSGGNRLILATYAFTVENYLCASTATTC